MNKDSIADNVIWKKAKLSYNEVHAYEWTDDVKCRLYVERRYPGLGKAGVTRRSRKLWNAAADALRVSNHEQIDNSIWKVSWNVYTAINSEQMPLLKNKSHHYGHIFESSAIMSVLGYVSAPDENSAKMAAFVTLGPRAHSKAASVVRVGIGGWAEAKKRNDELCTNYRNLVEHAKRSLTQKQWELEQIECQVAFFESGATFDSVNHTEMNENVA